MADPDSFPVLPAHLQAQGEAIQQALASGDPETQGRAVRDAFELCRLNPKNADLDAFATRVFEVGSAYYVQSLPLVGGTTYPRSDEQKASDKTVRDAIRLCLKRKVHPSKINPESLERAFPDQIAQARAEVETLLKLADTMLDPELDIMEMARTGAPLPIKVEELFKALTQPPIYGSYEELTQERTRMKGETAAADRPAFKLGFQVDHYIRNEYVRSGARNPADQVLQRAFSTMLHDGQTAGSQHRFASDGQKRYKEQCKVSGTSPTFRSYFAAAEIWMAEIYRRGDLFVDWIDAAPSPTPSKKMILEGSETNFGLKRGSLIRRAERDRIARAAARAVTYLAIRHEMKENGIGLDDQLTF